MIAELPQKILFVGVGGMGMAPLARWMESEGHSISGYDDNLHQNVRELLLQSGVHLEDLILSERVKDFDLIVRSSAIGDSHRLMVEAKACGIPVLRRGELLARVAEKKRFIAIVGSHGKTTTSGMVIHAMLKSGRAVNYILGGLFEDDAVMPSMSAASDWLIAEVDESDGTIDLFSPEITVLLNVDWDHADRYENESKLLDAFAGLIKRTTRTVIMPVEEFRNGKLRYESKAVMKTFGEWGDYSLRQGDQNEWSFQTGEKSASIAAPQPGRFNETNGLAALAALSEIGIEPKFDVLSGFCGMGRRQSVLFADACLTIIGDYAHHPTEIKALLECLRKKAPEKRLVVVFQPHRFSRTKQFKSEFATVLGEADSLYLMPVYAAHEESMEGGELSDLVAAFEGEKPTVLNGNVPGLLQLRDELKETGDLLVFVGAGDIEQSANVFTSLIRKKGDVGLAWDDYMGRRISAGSVYRREEPLAKKTTMRIGGMASYYAEPADLIDLRAFLNVARLFELPVYCIGRGSNILVPDQGIDGLVIRFASEKWRQIIPLDAGRLWVGAGVRLKEICGFAAKAGMSGFEFLEGIPGAVGGSLRMNAGAMGSWIFDVVERVQYLDESGKFIDQPQSAFHFGYRKVEEISRGIALGAVIKCPDNQAEGSIRERMDSYSSIRKASQPREPSAGCIFKNPEGNYAGKLIDEYGLKGMSVGGAEVSSMHGNFVVNRGGATAEDVIALIRAVRERIKDKAGYELEPEVLLLGQSWEAILGTSAECVGGEGDV